MKLTKEQQILVENNHNLIGWFAKQKGLDFDEYYDILAIGLCKAAMAYEEEKGKFSSLAYKCMYNELKLYYATINKKSCIPYDKIISYEGVVGKDNCSGSDLYLYDCLADKNYNILDIVSEEMMVSYLMTKLNLKETEIFQMLLSGLKQQEIAGKLNFSKQSISQYVKSIRKKLTPYLTE